MSNSFKSNLFSIYFQVISLVFFVAWSFETYHHSFSHNFFLTIGLLTSLTLSYWWSPLNLSLHSILWSLVLVETGQVNYSLLSAASTFMLAFKTLHVEKKVNRNSSPEDEILLKHDYSNQIHELLLFLSHKKNIGATLTKEEFNHLIFGIKNLQEMFRLNLDQEPSEKIHSSEVIHLIEFIGESYFSNSNQEFHVHYSKIEELHYVMFSSMSLSRIINNIMKNIFEFNSKRIEVLVEIKNEYLEIVFLNSKEKLTDDNIAYLSRSKEPSGFGLKSIQAICDEIGGDFSFYPENENWRSVVSIPFSKESFLPKKVA